MAKVLVVIDPKTSVRSYEVEGVGGVACDEITEALSMANEVVDKQYTSEFYDLEQIPDYVTD